MLFCLSVCSSGRSGHALLPSLLRSSALEKAALTMALRFRRQPDGPGAMQGYNKPLAGARHTDHPPPEGGPARAP